MPSPVAGHRVGWYPAHRMVVAEGHPDADGLCSPDELPGVLVKLEQSICDFGIPLAPYLSRKRWSVRTGVATQLPGFAGIRRLDATADLAFDSRGEGQAVLDGVAALARLRQKAEVWYEKGAVQTVYFLGHGGKRKLGRWYDKGAESGLAPRGRLIRPEDQRRYTSANRRDVEELTTSYVREKFQQRFIPLWRASKGVVVAGRDQLTDRVLELLEADELTIREAERLAGYLALRDRIRARGIDSDDYEAGRSEECARRNISRTTEWRRESELLANGLVPTDEAGTETTVDLHAVLSEVLESDAWTRRG